MFLLMGCCKRGQRPSLVEFAGEATVDASKPRMAFRRLLVYFPYGNFFDSVTRKCGKLLALRFETPYV
jgi:hypothetical protein